LNVGLCFYSLYIYILW